MFCPSSLRYVRAVPEINSLPQATETRVERQHRERGSESKETTREFILLPHTPTKNCHSEQREEPAFSLSLWWRVPQVRGGNLGLGVGRVAAKGLPACRSSAVDPHP